MTWNVVWAAAALQNAIIAPHISKDRLGLSAPMLGQQIEIGSYPVASSGTWIAYGPDGALWFTQPGVNAIGRMTSAGIASSYKLPTAHGQSTGITAPPDGALWFTEYTGDKIGRITTAVKVNEFPIPAADREPEGITARWRVVVYRVKGRQDRSRVRFS